MREFLKVKKWNMNVRIVKINSDILYKNRIKVLCLIYLIFYEIYTNLSHNFLSYYL